MDAMHQSQELRVATDAQWVVEDARDRVLDVDRAVRETDQRRSPLRAHVKAQRESREAHQPECNYMRLAGCGAGMRNPGTQACIPPFDIYLCPAAKRCRCVQGAERYPSVHPANVTLCLVQDGLSLFALAQRVA